MDGTAVRTRILEAAFEAFMKSGYAASSTLEIATRARVSKREIYALVGNKQEMLIACISERARRLRAPSDLPVPRDRDTLARVLASFGAQLVREVSDPTVVAVFAAGDCRGGSGAGGRAGTRFRSARNQPRHVAQDHDRGSVVRVAERQPDGVCRTVRRAPLGKSDDQPAAWRRQATEPARNRRTRSRRSCRFPATSPATVVNGINRGFAR